MAEPTTATSIPWYESPQVISAGIGAAAGLAGSLMDGKNQKSTTTTQLDPAVAAANANLLSRGTAQSQTPQAYYPGATVAPQSEFGFAGQQLAMNQLPAMAELSEAQRLATLQGLGLQAENDPRTLAMADAATQPIIDQFQESILPSMQSQAISQGAFGGSRQNINEGIAAGKVADAAMRARAGVLGNAFNSSLQNTQAMLSLAPGVNQQQLAPAGVLEGLGAQQENREQNLINAEMQRFGFEQQAPNQALSNLANIVNTTNGGQTVTQNVPGAQTNPIAAAFGGAAAAQGLFAGAGQRGPGPQPSWATNDWTTGNF